MDGGGSSALALRMPGKDGFTIENEPSDGSLRAVCTYILFVTDAAANGSARSLFIEQDGAYVLAGSSVELSYAATDNALRTVETPAVTASATRGSVSGNVYKAPASEGTDTIRLSSGTAYGSGTLHVITKADTLKVTDAATGHSAHERGAGKGRDPEPKGRSAVPAARRVHGLVRCDLFRLRQHRHGDGRRGVHGHGQPRSPRARSRSRPRD